MTFVYASSYILVIVEFFYLGGKILVSDVFFGMIVVCAFICIYQ